MTEAMNTPERILRLAFYLNLFLLLLADRHALWTEATVLLPWAIALANTNNRMHLSNIVLSHKFLTATSVGLTLLIAAGCHSHTCASYEINAAMIPLLWIPVASLTCAVKTKSETPIFLTSAAAATTLSILIIWQYFIENLDRPPGLSFNVLSTPFILSMLCLMGSTRKPSNCKPFQHLFYMAATLGIIASICTDAKTGLLAFMAGTAVHLTCNPRNTMKILTIATPIALVWTFSLSEKIKTIHTDITRYENNEYITSFGERSDALRWGTEHFLDNPFLGKGSEAVTDQFNNRWQEWMRASNSNRRMPHLHNDYLQIAVSKGIPALICFATLWIGAAAKCLQRKHDVRKRTWLLSLTGIYMTAFMTDSFTYWNSTWAAATACAGVAIGLLAQPTSAAAGPRSWPAAKRADA